MANVSSFLERSVSEYKSNNKISKVRTAIIGIISADPAFNTSRYDDAINYVQEKGILLSILFENLDESKFPSINNDKSQWNTEYFAKATIYCENNFCKERINHLREVGKKVYGVSDNLLEDIGQVKNELSRQTSKVAMRKKELQKEHTPIWLYLVLAAVAIVILVMILK